VSDTAASMAEVCKAHTDPDCKACDEFDDELWIHPRDLNECGSCGRRYARENSFYDDDDPPLCPCCGDDKAAAAECRLCQIAIKTREADNASCRERIATNDSEIAEIQRGDRHNDFHRAYGGNP
jgi:hypothetical protein